jgi:hypothetical protein
METRRNGMHGLSKMLNYAESALEYMQNINATKRMRG